MPKYTADVAVKPFVKVYLKSLFGEPAVLPKDHLFNSLLKIMLNRPKRTNEYYAMALYTEKIAIVISSHQFFNDGFSLTNTHTVIFNNTVEDYIRGKLIEKIEAYRDRDYNIKNSIELAIEDIGIGDGLMDYETVKKNYYRYRVRLSKTAVLKIYNTSVPNLSRKKIAQ
jgi:hypothetical protein